MVGNHEFILSVLAQVMMLVVIEDVADQQLPKLIESEDGVEPIIGFAALAWVRNGSGHEVNKLLVGDAKPALDDAFQIGSVGWCVMHPNAERMGKAVGGVALELSTVGKDRFRKMVTWPCAFGNLDAVPGAEGDLILNDVVDCEHGAEPTRAFQRDGDAGDHATEDIHASVNHRTPDDAAAVERTDEIDVADGRIDLVNGAGAERHLRRIAENLPPCEVVRPFAAPRLLLAPLISIVVLIPVAKLIKGGAHLRWQEQRRRRPVHDRIAIVEERLL